MTTKKSKYWTKEACTTHVTDLKDHLEKKFAGRNERIKQVYDRRFHLNPVTIPENYEENIPNPYRSNLIHDFCRRVGALFPHQLPTVIIEPARPGEKAQKQSSEGERFWTLMSLLWEPGQGDVLRR